MNRFILNYLGVFFLLLSILSFFNIIYSYYFNLYLNVNTYFYTLLISLIVGIVSLIKKKDDIKVTIYTKIISVIIGYLILPLVISIPYYFSIYNISFINCYFESISGFTSTGFTIFENIKHLDESLILWRSTSQWFGGIYFLFSILLLIDIFDDSLKKSLTNFISFSYSETFKQSLKIFVLYSLLTLFLFLCLKLINLRTFDSFNLSMTIISSGGFLPFNDISSVINSNTKEVVFKNVSFKYSENTLEVLNKINFKIKKGERIGIIGKSGSGKSTLLEVLMGLLQPSKGKLLIDGVDINNSDSPNLVSQWRRSISYVPQDIFLADSSFAENIAFGFKKEELDINRVKDCARRAKISDLIEQSSFGYRTNVGEKGIRLSGGQCQRIGIARALYKNNKILVFDEATSALDNKTESELMESIEALSKDLTIIIIAHRLSTVEVCDKVFSIEDGSLVKSYI